MTEQIKLAIACALLLIAFASGWTLKGWKDDSIRLAIKEATEASRAASAQASAEAIAKIPAPKVYVGTAKSKVYTDCVNTDEVWNEFVKGFK